MHTKIRSGRCNRRFTFAVDGDDAEADDPRLDSQYTVEFLESIVLIEGDARDEKVVAELDRRSNGYVVSGLDVGRQLIERHSKAVGEDEHRRDSGDAEHDCETREGIAQRALKEVLPDEAHQHDATLTGSRDEPRRPIRSNR